MTTHTPLNDRPTNEQTSQQTLAGELADILQLHTLMLRIEVLAERVLSSAEDERLDDAREDLWGSKAAWKNICSLLQSMGQMSQIIASGIYGDLPHQLAQAANKLEREQSLFDDLADRVVELLNGAGQPGSSETICAKDCPGSTPVPVSEPGGTEGNRIPDEIVNLTQSLLHLNLAKECSDTFLLRNSDEGSYGQILQRMWNSDDWDYYMDCLQSVSHHIDLSLAMMDGELPHPIGDAVKELARNEGAKAVERKAIRESLAKQFADKITQKLYAKRMTLEAQTEDPEPVCVVG